MGQMGLVDVGMNESPEVLKCGSATVVKVLVPPQIKKIQTQEWA